MSSHLSAYCALAGAIAFEIAGTTFLQRSEQFTKAVPTLSMMAFYAAAFFLLSLALRALPLGIAYAIWSGVGVVLTAIIGVMVFKQSLDLPAMAGIAMIVGGVVIIQTSSTATGH